MVGGQPINSIRLMAFLFGGIEMEQVKCDACRVLFTIEVKVKKYEQGIEEQYFHCPHCHERYQGAVTDAIARKIQVRMNKLRAQFYKEQRRLHAHMAKLEKKIEQL